MNAYPREYRRLLPHIHPELGVLSINYRLEGSIPMHIIEQYKADYEKKEAAIYATQTKPLQIEQDLHYLRRAEKRMYETILDANANGPYHLQSPEIAKIVMDSLHFLEKDYIDIHAYCLMPNHIHLLLSVRPDSPTLTTVMERHKGFTGLRCNQHLNKKGAFWAKGFYDHIVRNEQSFFKHLYYILQNPVTANLVDNWKDWKYTYYHPDLEEYINGGTIIT